MTNAVVSLTPPTLAAPGVYRIRKRFAVIQFDVIQFDAAQFDGAAKGRIVFLPEGSELRLIGSSCLSKCVEVAHENQFYNIFQADLLGPWSTLIQPIPMKPGRMKPTPTLASIGACA
jgi:hypothetical protein